MYDPGVTSSQLEKASRELSFDPEYHGVQECQKNKRHFQDLIHPETGELKRPLFQDEIRWIENERVICQWDYGYFATRYAVILNWENQLQVFTPNIAQQIIWDIQAEMERAGHSIMIQQLKARQLGVSTDTELKVAHRVQFHPYVNAVVASARGDKSLKMSEMMARCWAEQPWFLMPQRGRWTVGDVPGMMEFGAQHSAVSIQHGAQLMGISRGDTPTVGHLSEIAEFVNAEQLIQASLLNAVHESPFVFFVLEGTGAGKTNWWYRTWQFAKANWPLGRSRLRPVFLPWYIGRDIYPTDTWLRMHPVPKDWSSEGATLAHANKAREYVARNDLLRKYLGDGWAMPPEQMWFWEVSRAEYKANGNLASFYSELCADDIEAFSSPGISVFDAEIIVNYRDRMVEPIGAFGLKGPESVIPKKLQPSKWETNHDLPVIPIDSDFKLVPLRYQGVSTVDPLGKIFLWEFPDENEEYGLGIDPCNGVGSDRGVIEVVRKGTVQRNDGQVAEFANPHLNAAQMVPWCHALAKYLSRGGRQAKLVIEQTCGGNILQLELRKLGWSNFHVDLRGYNQKVIDRGKSLQLGWYMHPAARDGLITKLLDLVRAGLVDINSPWFIDEMGDLQANELTQKIAAERGAHDDRIMAIGMVLFSLHDLEMRTKLPTIAQQRASALEAEVKAPRWSPGLQSIDIPGFTPAAIFRDELLSEYEPEEDTQWQ